MSAHLRHWGTILQGNQIPLEDFKKEFDAMLEHMRKPSEKK